jgi:hypothetical protein
MPEMQRLLSPGPSATDHPLPLTTIAVIADRQGGDERKRVESWTQTSESAHSDKRFIRSPRQHGYYGYTLMTLFLGQLRCLGIIAPCRRSRGRRRGH